MRCDQTCVRRADCLITASHPPSLLYGPLCREREGGGDGGVPPALSPLHLVSRGASGCETLRDLGEGSEEE